MSAIKKTHKKIDALTVIIPRRGWGVQALGHWIGWLVEAMVEGVIALPGGALVGPCPAASAGMAWLTPDRFHGGDH